jgi:hypothetical protein
MILPAIEGPIIKISAAIGRTLFNGLAAYAAAYCGQPLDLGNYGSHLEYYSLGIKKFGAGFRSGVSEATYMGHLHRY